MRIALVAAVVLVLLAACSVGVQAGVVTFSSNRCPHNPDYGCAQSIWTVNDDGAGMRRVTLGLDAPHDKRGNDFSPSWSPDGSRIVFMRRLYPDRNQLWTVRADGSDLRPLGPELPNSELRFADHPEWSPDGRWIAFTGTPLDPPPGPGWFAMADIYLIAADGSELRRVTSDPAVERFPSFTPDGRRLVFQSGSGLGGPGEGLVAVDLDGSNRTPLMVGELPPNPHLPEGPAGDLSISHSPDGRWVAFSRLGRIFLLSADGGEPHEHLDIGHGNGNMEIQWAWEPHPMFIFSLPFERKPLFAVDLFGGAPPRPLGPAPEGRSPGDQNPDWLPSAPPRLPPDTSGPVSVLSSPERQSVRPSELGFLTVDPSGVSRVEAAVAKRVSRRGRARCRFIVRPRRFGAARPCGRPRYRAVGSVPDLRELLAGAPAARYRLSLRAVDATGRVGTARTLRITLRPRSRSTARTPTGAGASAPGRPPRGA